MALTVCWKIDFIVSSTTSANGALVYSHNEINQEEIPHVKFRIRRSMVSITCLMKKMLAFIDSLERRGVRSPMISSNAVDQLVAGPRDGGMSDHMCSSSDCCRERHRRMEGVPQIVEKWQVVSRLQD